jgi:hypothetical protein
VSKSRAKRGIIHITYTETVLGNAKTASCKKGVHTEGHFSTVKVKQFRTDEICEITDKSTARQVTDRYESIVGSPYIGKNRGKGPKTVNFFTGQEFLNIDLNS